MGVPVIKKVDADGKVIKRFKTWVKNNPGVLYFDSEFERQCWLRLKKSGLKFERNQESILLQDTFKTKALSKNKKGKKKVFISTVRPISYTPDFKIFCERDYVVYLETKGFFREDARLRYKLFLNKLAHTPSYKKTSSYLIFSLADLNFIIDYCKTELNNVIPYKKIEL
jgi:hypothetical protein